MKLFNLAYRNFFRNTRRSIISGISVALAITAIIFARSYIAGILENMSGNVIKLISGHITITTKEYERRERLIPLSESIALSDEFYRSLPQGDIELVSPRIKFGVLLGEEELSIPALGYALDPEKEQNIAGLQKRLVDGDYIRSGERAAILGEGLAERLNMTVGDTLTVITRTAYDSPTGLNFVIKGLFHTGIGGMDRSIFYIPLDIGQAMLDLEGRATEIVILLKDPGKAVQVARAIDFNDDYSVVPFQFHTVLRYVNMAEAIYSVFYLVVLLVACSAIANTMLMIVFERTKEIGMMKALGLNNLSIVGLLVIEAGFIGTVGSLLGSIIGTVLSYWLKYKGIDISMVSSTTSADMPFGPIIYLAPTPFIVATAFIMGLLVTIIIALLPISRAIRINPAKALKTI
ncbi:MAG: ABC transporter permease [candidate division WOR-3 bacterium]|nr:MAG: ABC transporter permease [candidate division WOR-3 bacterium]